MTFIAFWSIPIILGIVAAFETRRQPIAYLSETSLYCLS